MSTNELVTATLAAGYDVERNGVHIYRRGSMVQVLKFVQGGKGLEEDETFEISETEAAVARFLELAPPPVTA